MNFRKVLVISPHTDDGECGAGGTISRLVDEGSEVHYLALSAPTEELVEECLRATNLLGVKDTKVMKFSRRNLQEHRQEILQVFHDIDKEIKPDLVLVPSTRDIHQDHQVATREASRGIFRHSTILGYELPQNIRTFNYIVSLSDENLKRKIFTMSQYKSQLNRFYFHPDFVRSWARFRGGQIDKEYAEAFEVIKSVKL